MSNANPKMSNISQERYIEMEAEMDRFEQEILAQDSDDLPKVIIGSSTYNQVAAQLKMRRSVPEHSREHREHREEPQNEDSDDEHDYDADRSMMLDRNEPPPKKPSFDVPLLPPPPPPPSITSTPSFVPHQIRHRQPPGSRPGMHGPPRMRPPPPPPRHYGGPHMGHGPGPGPMSGPGPGPMQGPPGRFMGPRPGMGPMGPYGPGSGPPRPHMGMGMGPGMGMPMGGPHDAMGGGMYGISSGEQHASFNEDKEEEESSVDASLEDRPKVIYASAPVITKQKEPKKKKKKKKKTEQVASEGADTPSDSVKSSVDLISEAPAAVAGPIQVHMPVELEHDDHHIADMEIDNPYMPKKEKKEKKKKFVRMAAGTTWEDASLAEWTGDDFRLFCGDLGNEVTDEVLARAFSKYPSFIRSKVIRDKRTNKTKGYGFVSFKDPTDYVRAMREMNGKYVGNRPIKLRKSNWKERNIDSVKKKEREKKRLGLR